MIEVAVSYGFGEENRYNLENVPPSIQLSLYKYDLYEKYKDQIWKAIEENKTKVHAIHLPIDSLKRDYEDTHNIMVDGLRNVGCTKYVIHPNRFVKSYIDVFLQTGINVQLCIENFQWRKKKEIRSPLEIVETCLDVVTYEHQHNLRMTFDTSHADDIWFDHKILPFLLSYTAIIHLSNRSRKFGPHMPFNSPKGELNLVRFVHELKHRYKWNGIIVLEYMEQYSDKLMKNYEYLKKIVS